MRHTLRSSSDLCSQNRRKERKRERERGGGEPWPRFDNGTSPLCVLSVCVCVLAPDWNANNSAVECYAV